MSIRCRAIANCAMCLALAAACRAQPASPEWQPGFHLPGISAPACSGFGGAGTVVCATEYSDGQQPGATLYAGGDFSALGDQAIAFIARRVGGVWQALGSGLNGPVVAMSVHDDGTGPSLFVAGRFTQAGGIPTPGLARWNGVAWSAVGNGLAFTPNCLLSVPGGATPLLYIGGSSVAGPPPVDSVELMQWDGQTLAAVPTSGITLPIRTLIRFDDGTGPALFAGAGVYRIEGSQGGVYRQIGGSWSRLGNGLCWSVMSIAAYDGGGGERLYAGGTAGSTGSCPAPLRLATWSGTDWTAVGGADIQNNGVLQLSVQDDGAGPALFAVGRISAVGTTPAEGIAKWNGSQWSAFTTGTTCGVWGLTRRSAGGFVAVGDFDSLDGVPASGIAQWSPSGWAPLVAEAKGTTAVFNAMLPFRDGSQGPPSLYATGSRGYAGAVPASIVHRWAAGQWHAAPQPQAPRGNDLVVHDDGTGPRLFLASGSDSAQPAESVFRLDPSGWTATAVAAHSLTVSRANVATLQSIALPSHQGLFASGPIGAMNGVAGAGAFLFSGGGWQALGSLESCISGGDGKANSIVYDDGTGPALYVCGSSLQADGGGANPCGALVRWNGSAWQQLLPGSGRIGPMQVFSAGQFSPPVLIAGGSFTLPGGGQTVTVASWSGSQWTPVRTSSGFVAALAVFDDWSGPGVFAAENSGDATSSQILKVLGAPGQAIPPIQGQVTALAVYDDGNGPSLLASGRFSRAGTTISNNYAALRFARACAADWNRDGVISPADVSGFVLAWFSCLTADNLLADFDRSAVVDPADVATFVRAWIAAMSGGC